MVKQSKANQLTREGDYVSHHVIYFFSYFDHFHFGAFDFLSISCAIMSMVTWFYATFSRWKQFS